MRTLEFKMERTGLLEEGQELEVTEYNLPRSYYYVLGTSFAMSENIPLNERLKSKTGKVTGIKETDRGFYVTVEFDEDSPA